jgi:hypothetical protein
MNWILQLCGARAPKVRSQEAPTTASPTPSETPSETTAAPAEPTPTLATLAQSGDNLVLVNPEFFIEEEKLRMKIRADKKAALDRFESSIRPVTFTPFPRLAPELRQEIWKYTASDGRLIEFTYFSHEKTVASMFPSRTLVPAILHTNQEARACGLEIYEKLNFGSSFISINSTYINWEIDVVSFKRGRALAAFMSLHFYMEEIPKLGEDVEEQSGPESTQSVISEKCRNLAVHCSDLTTLRTELRPKILFRNLNNFMVLAPSGELGTWMDGNLALAPLAEGTDTTAINMQIESLQEMYPQKDGTGWGTKDKKICIMDVVRERHRLMTAEEKQARPEVQQGKEKVANEQAVKAEAFVCPKTKAQLEKEAKQKQFEEDLILAAT